MMEGLDLLAAGGSALLVALMIAAEGLLSGPGLLAWLNSLKKPRLYPPLWVWMLVALSTYLLQGVIAYRLLTTLAGSVSYFAFAALAATMAGNVVYNVALARQRDPRLTFIGILWFLAPLLVLQVLLLEADPAAGALNLVYLAWVLGFDLPIMYRLWRLNVRQSETGNRKRPEPAHAKPWGLQGRCTRT
jgi:tryptophan-rich sensory protein